MMSTSIAELSIQFLQGMCLIAIAPLLTGLLRFFKARLQQRRRSTTTIWQPYRDLGRLIAAPSMRASTTSWVFALTPVILLVAYGLLSFAVPVFYPQTLVTTDFIVVIYVLGLARFVLSLAGLDAGAPFGGLGGSREMFLHFLTEIGLMLFLAGLVLRWHTVRLDELYAEQSQLGFRYLLEPSLILLGLSLAIILLFETGRIPIDNLATHLELTMGHKAILLEYAGRDLAVIKWAEMIKLGFMLTLFGDLFIPFPNLSDLAMPTNLIASSLLFGIAFLIKTVLLVLVLAIGETLQPKLRLRKIKGTALAAIALSLLAIINILSLTATGR
jgi:formate hydrogenlyase subunit 4